MYYEFCRADFTNRHYFMVGRWRLMFYTIEELKKIFGDDNLTYDDFDAYYNECIEEMLPFTLSERPVKENNHENERF